MTKKLYRKLIPLILLHVLLLASAKNELNTCAVENKSTGLISRQEVYWSLTKKDFNPEVTVLPPT